MNMHTVKMIMPRQDISDFYDSVCFLLTDYENGELTEKDLYSFLVNIQNEIELLEWDFT